MWKLLTSGLVVFMCTNVVVSVEFWRFCWVVGVFCTIVKAPALVCVLLLLFSGCDLHLSKAAGKGF